MYRPGKAAGMVQSMRRRSVFLTGVWQESHAVVPIEKYPSWSATAPAPIVAAWLSQAPATTGVPAGSPSSSATVGRSAPSTASTGTRSGNFARSTPA